MRITELTLQTNQLSELIGFYRDVLKLKVDEHDGGAFSIDTAGTRIEFVAADPGLEPYYHFAFNIPENNLPAAKNWLSDKVTLIPNDGKDEFHFESWNAHAVYFFDPANNIVEFIARHNLSNGASGEFGPADLLEISEIGLVVDDVPSMTLELERELDIPTYDGPTETFCAAGDERGLLIIVRRDRMWFPNRELKGRVFPTTVKIAGDRPRDFSSPGLPYRVTVG